MTEVLLGSHARWIAAAAGRGVPLPDPLPSIVLGPHPVDLHRRVEQQLSRFDPATNRVYLVRANWRNRGTFGHEFGHAFATQYLVTRELRNRAAALLGHPGLRWYWRNWNPMTHYKQPNEENFADAYGRLFCGITSPRLRRLRRFLVEVKEGHRGA